MKTYILIAAAILLGIIGFKIFYVTEEDRIRNLIAKSEAAVVDKDIDGLMDSVSFNYMDKYGNSYLGLKKSLESVFRNFDIIDIERTIKNISINYTLAEVELSVRVLVSSGEEKGYILGDAGTPQLITIVLEKPSNKWLIIRVEGLFDKTKAKKESDS